MTSRSARSNSSSEELPSGSPTALDFFISFFHQRGLVRSAAAYSSAELLDTAVEVTWMSLSPNPQARQRRGQHCGVDRGEVASDVSDPCLVLLHFERG